MFTYDRTTSHWLTPHRLDTYYYDPKFITHVITIRDKFDKMFRIGDVFNILDGTHESIDTSSVRDQTYNVLFLRAQDIDSCYLRNLDGAFIRKFDHYHKCKRSQIRHGDILLNIMATTGESCFYNENYSSEANANRAVGILRAKSQDLDDISKRFICVLISSKIGNLELARNLKGSIQQRLNLEDIANCELPEFTKLAQTYIGGKVRMAERLRERSRYLITSAKLLLESLLENRITEEELKLAQKALELGDKRPDYQILNKLNENIQIASHEQASKWVRRCPAFEMTSRIDCHFYNPDASSEIEKVKKCNPKPLLDYVVEKRSEPPIHTDHYSKNGIAIVSPTNFTDFKIELEGTNKLNLAYKELFGEFLMQEGNIIFSLVGDVGHACVVPEPAPLAITYRRTAQIKLKGINPYLVATFLNCRTGDLQLKRMTTGVIQAQLRLEDSVEVLIPSWAIRVQNYIGDKVRLGLQMQEQVEYLTTAAKLLVEALIEGKITEDELKTAQISLQKGDKEPDKAILSRLTRKGIDIKDEPPLFPDIDALYEIIDQISKDGEEET